MPKKEFMTCPLCKGKKVLPAKILAHLPKAQKGQKCTHCKGKGEVPKK